MKEPETPPSLEALGEQIALLQDKVVSRSKPRESSNTGALQVGLELVAGVLIGVGSGIMLDKWLHSSPLFLILCFLLGTGGGILTIYRMAKVQEAKFKTEVTDESDGKS